MAIGNPVALLASALERDTRGFISITTISPSAGFTANWMFEPPVSTPMRRMQANAASRIRWYSTSVRVCAGATVIESPVCTPIGSRFSIEQTTTTLSAWSRITSSSNSFQPSTDRSTRISDTGLAASPRLRNLAQLVGVARESGAAASEDERRSHDHGIADVLGDRDRFLEPVRQPGARDGEADLLHRGLERRAVLGRVDRLDTRADQLDTEPVEHPRVVEPDRDVQRGLATEGREQRVGSLSFDDPRDELDIQGLDVGRVGELRIRHDRRRVRVDEDHAEAFAAQQTTRLRAGVVELARLADDDGTTPHDEDGVEVGALGHGGYRISAMRSVNAPKRYDASCGPGAASGWCCTLNAGTPRTFSPSTVPSFRFTWVMSAPPGMVSAATT